MTAPTAGCNICLTVPQVNYLSILLQVSLTDLLSSSITKLLGKKVQEFIRLQTGSTAVLLKWGLQVSCSCKRVSVPLREREIRKSSRAISLRSFCCRGIRVGFCPSGPVRSCRVWGVLGNLQLALQIIPRPGLQVKVFGTTQEQA